MAFLVLPRPLGAMGWELTGSNTRAALRPRLRGAVSRGTVSRLVSEVGKSGASGAISFLRRKRIGVIDVLIETPYATSHGACVQNTRREVRVIGLAVLERSKTQWCYCSTFSTRAQGRNR
jgi:hypothetical protein